MTGMVYPSITYIIYMYIHIIYVINIIYLFVHLLREGGTVPMALTEDSLHESLLSFFHVGPRDETHIVRLGSEYFTTELSHWLQSLMTQQ